MIETLIDLAKKTASNRDTWKIRKATSRKQERIRNEDEHYGDTRTTHTQNRLTQLGGPPPRAARTGRFTPMRSTTTTYPSSKRFMQHNTPLNRLTSSRKRVNSGLQQALAVFSCHAGRCTTSFEVAPGFHTEDSSNRLSFYYYSSFGGERIKKK